MRVTLRPRLTVIAAAVGLLAAVATQAASNPPAPASDAEIERNIRDRFAKSKIGANGFRVSVKGGVATIDGKTEVIQHKGVATRLAKAGGARAVNNRIEVSESARKKAAANLSEGRRRSPKQRSEPRSEPRAAPKAQSGTAATQDASPAPQPRRAVVRWPK